MTMQETESTLRVPPGLALFTAVAAVSWAGPLIRFASAPALAISAWRLNFSVAFILLVVLVRRRGKKRSPLDARMAWLALASGGMLAGHFWAWVASVQLTTVASSVVLYSTHPFFVAALSILFLGERPARQQWVGIMVAVAGAVLIGSGDLGLGSRALVGDALALLSAVLIAGYFVIGRSLRKTLDLWTYVALVYGAAAFVLSVILLASPGIPVVAYPGRDWLVFLALAAGPMMLGHTGINYTLRYYPAYLANLAALGEPIGATLIAWLLPAISEVPSAQTLVGGAMVLLGITLGVLPERSRKSGDPR
jgi:drug/metabolite transporter (DMT)-like permease